MTFELVRFPHRLPGIYHVCDEEGRRVLYVPGKYQKGWPFAYQPSEQERELKAQIEAQFPGYEIVGTSPTPTHGAFEARRK